jgi:hypothetical protein
MAANELDAAMGFVEGFELNRSPGQDLLQTFAGSAIAMLPNRYLDSIRADTR